MPVKVYDGTNWVTVAGDGQQGAAATSSTIATWVKTASGGETTLSGNDDNSVSLSYTAGQELLYINGVLQKRAVDYIATTGTTITGLNALVAGDIVTVWTVNAFSVTNAIPNSTVTAKGDLIVGTGTGTYTAQTVGTNGQVLTADSAEADGVKWATPAGGSGLTLIKRASFSAVASTTTTFDSVFTSTYDNYVIVADKVYGTSANANLQFQWRVGATTQSAASWYGAYFGYSYSGTLTTNSVNATTSFPLSQVGADADETTGFNLTTNKVVTSNKPQIFGTLYEANRAVPLALGAKYNTAIAADGFILSLSTGNITGTVSVYGLAKA
jgi:hypothetical protein